MEEGHPFSYQSAFQGWGGCKVRLGRKGGQVSKSDSAAIPQPGQRWSQVEEGRGKERASAYN